jgi:steroid delta-isomerase-like uncharacterized protein
MTVDENVAAMKRWFDEVWNQGRVQAIHDLLADDFVGTGQDQPGVAIHGPTAFVTLYNRLRGAFPDFRLTIEDAFGAGDKVTVRWLAVMTHTGDHLGIPATHRTARISGITIARFAGEKVAEGWDNWDQLALMQQLSAPADAAARAGQ